MVPGASLGKYLGRHTPVSQRACWLVVTSKVWIWGYGYKKLKKKVIRYCLQGKTRRRKSYLIPSVAVTAGGSAKTATTFTLLVDSGCWNRRLFSQLASTHSVVSWAVLMRFCHTRRTVLLKKHLYCNDGECEPNCCTIQQIEAEPGTIFFFWVIEKKVQLSLEIFRMSFYRCFAAEKKIYNRYSYLTTTRGKSTLIKI